MSTDDIETIKQQIAETEQTAAQLRAELETRRQAAKASVIEEIRARMGEYGISADELGKSRRVKKTGFNPCCSGLSIAARASWSD